MSLMGRVAIGSDGGGGQLEKLGMVRIWSKYNH